MACGCSDDTCNCIVQDGGDIVVSGTGTAGDPYIVTFTETTFDGQEGDGIEITAGGTKGHEPTIGVKVDPSSTADVTLSPAGLKVDLPTGTEIPALSFQPGMMMEWGGPTANVPSLWLPCDGSLKLQASYPELFAAIGHLHNGGVDPGGGQFRLPDARKRPTYGPGAGDNIGEIDGTYGSESAYGKTHDHAGTTSSDATGLTVDGLAAGTRTADATDEGEGSSHHSGHIIKGTGVDALVGDADLTIGNTDFAPAGDGAEVKFTKLTHDHDFTHGHSVADPGHDHTFTTDSQEMPHLIVEKIIFAGV